MSTREELRRYWPLFGLELRTPRLLLTPLAEEDLPGLIQVIMDGVHAPGAMPFGIPWTLGEPAAVAAGSLRHWWGLRAAVAPDKWEIQFGVHRDGQIIGCQSLRATNFPLLRSVGTGSWLGFRYQGDGVGTEMRSAVLQFAFDTLSADRAASGAFVDNPPSLAVSAKLGYEPNGVSRKARRPGEAALHQDLLVTADTLVRPAWKVAVSGFEECLELLGLT